MPSVSPVRCPEKRLEKGFSCIYFVYMRKVLLVLKDDDRAALEEAANRTETSMSQLVRLCIRRALAGVVMSLKSSKERLREEVDWSDLFDQPRRKVSAYVADEVRKASRR